MAEPTQASPKSRNTINQRQSRARRKTYISELEGKIRCYEAQGIQATREVQIAAQQVVEDNRRLRWILQQRFGVDEREISLLLSEQSNDRSDGRCPRCGAGPALPLREHTRQPQLPSPPYSDPEPQQKIAVQRPQQHLITHPPTSPQYAGGLSDPSAGKREVHLDSSLLDPPRPIPPQCRPPATSNSMPCEEAAAIIASMRGGLSSPQDYWPELGCYDADRCNVDNGRVMALMDGQGVDR